MKKLTFLVSLLFLFSIMPLVCLAQLFWNTNGSSASWTASNWGTSGSGPFTNAWVSNSNTEFTANSSVTFATTSIGNIKVNNGVTATLTAAGTLGTNGNVRTIDVDGSGYLDFNNQAISTAGGTGFIKNGTGVIQFFYNGELKSLKPTPFSKSLPLFPSFHLKYQGELQILSSRHR